MDAQGHILEYPKFKVSRIQIGTEVFTDVTAELDVHDPSYQADQIGQQGFLGTSLLKPYKVVLDYPHRRMTLIPPGVAKSASSCKGAIASFAPQWHGEPATPVDIDLGRLVVWWDTGTPTSLLSARVAPPANASFASPALTTQRLVLGGVDFGPWKFKVEYMTLPPGFDGMIGYNFFARHVVCMDFPDKVLLVQH